MKKKLAGLLVLLCVLIGFSQKNNLFSMKAGDLGSLNEQIKEIDKQIDQKNQELRTAGRKKEFTTAKELNQLQQRKQDLEKKLIKAKELIIARLHVRERITASTAQLDKKFIDELLKRSVLTIPDATPMAVNPHQPQIISITDPSSGVKSYDCVSGEKQWTLSIADINHVEFSSDGSKLLLIGYEKNVLVDAKTGKIIKEFTSHVHLSPGDKFVIETGDEHNFLTIKNIETRQPLKIQGMYDNVVLSKDDTKLGAYSLTNNQIEVWDLDKEKIIFTAPTPQTNVEVFSKDGNKLITFNSDASEVTIWDLNTQKQIKQIQLLTHSSPNFNDDEAPTKIIGAVDEKNIAVWDLNTGNELNRFSKNNNDSFQIDEKGSIIIISYADKLIKIWDYNTGKFIAEVTMEIPEQSPAITFFLNHISSDKNTLLERNQGGPLSLWDLKSREKLYSWPIGPDSYLLDRYGYIIYPKNNILQIFDTRTIFFLVSSQLTLPQVELLQAFQEVMMRTGGPEEPQEKRPARIHLTDEQAVTFNSFPARLQVILEKYVVRPAAYKPLSVYTLTK